MSANHRARNWLTYNKLYYIVVYLWFNITCFNMVLNCILSYNRIIQFKTLSYKFVLYQWSMSYCTITINIQSKFVWCDTIEEEIIRDLIITYTRINIISIGIIWWYIIYPQSYKPSKYNLLENINIIAYNKCWLNAEYSQICQPLRHYMIVFLSFSDLGNRNQAPYFVYIP